MEMVVCNIDARLCQQNYPSAVHYHLDRLVRQRIDCEPSLKELIEEAKEEMALQNLPELIPAAESLSVTEEMLVGSSVDDCDSSAGALNDVPPILESVHQNIESRAVVPYQSNTNQGVLGETISREEGIPNRGESLVVMPPLLRRWEGEIPPLPLERQSNAVDMTSEELDVFEDDVINLLTKPDLDGESERSSSVSSSADGPAEPPAVWHDHLEPSYILIQEPKTFFRTQKGAYRAFVNWMMESYRAFWYDSTQSAPDIRLLDPKNLEDALRAREIVSRRITAEFARDYQPGFWCSVFGGQPFQAITPEATIDLAKGLYGGMVNVDIYGKLLTHLLSYCGQMQIGGMKENKVASWAPARLFEIVKQFDKRYLEETRVMTTIFTVAKVLNVLTLKQQWLIMALPAGSVCDMHAVCKNTHSNRIVTLDFP